MNPLRSLFRAPARQLIHQEPLHARRPLPAPERTHAPRPRFDAILTPQAFQDTYGHHDHYDEVPLALLCRGGVR